MRRFASGFVSLRCLVDREPSIGESIRRITTCSGIIVLDGSTFILVLIAVTGFASVAAFGWAWWTGKLEELDAQSVSILDARDLRLTRPWESAADRAARAQSFGALLEPLPGEWGDARRR